MHLDITQALSADEATILPLMEEFNAEESIPWRPSVMIPALRRLLDEPSIGMLLIAREPAIGTVVGYGVATFGFDMEFGGRDAFITEVFVHSSFRRRGVGRALLDALTNRLRADGAGAVHLVVRHENTQARALYEAQGFAAVPRLLMTKSLAAVS